MNADKWTVGADPTQPLAIVAGTLHHYVIDASSSRFLGDPPIVLEPWNSKHFTNQQWTVGAAAGGGTGKTLAAGKPADDGGGYLPHCPTSPCCMGVHHDIVPDGDGGWSVIMLLLLGFTLYAAGGVAYGKRKGVNCDAQRARLAAYHPHYRQLMHMVGLCRDGWEFSRGVLQPARARARARALALPADGRATLRAEQSERKHVAKAPRYRNEEQTKSKRDKQKHSSGSKKQKTQEDKLSEQLLPATAPAPGPAPATPGRGGGRWVHVPN